jgi:type I restriction enzyme S subunit
MSQLPSGWVYAPLASFAEVQLGRQRSPKNHTGPNMRPYLRAANVTWAGLALDDVKTMHFSPAELATFRLAPGDILLAEASGSASEVGKPALWRGEIDDCCFQNTLLRVRTSDVRPRYLLWFFKWLALSGQFARGSRGVGIHHLGARALSEWDVPVAPLPEQDRIVAAIEEQLSRIDAGRAAVKRALTGVDRMRTAILMSAFGHLEAGSNLVVGRDVFTFITSGSRGWAKYYSDEGPKFLRIGNVPRRGIRLDLEDVQPVNPPTNAEGRRTQVRPGDVLISITADLGRVAVAPPTLGEAYINQHIALARPVEGVAPEFIAWYLASPFGLRQWDHLRRGATKIGLGLDDIRAVRIPLPDRDVQEATVEAIEKGWDNVRRLETVLNVCEQRVDRLCASMLTAAFSGNLVPQDRRDEAAEMLLTRLAANKGASTGPSSTGARAKRRMVTA